MKRNGRIALAAGALAAASSVAQAQEVYRLGDIATSTINYRMQAGNNTYAYGDDVVLLPTDNHQLGSIRMNFFVFTYDTTQGISYNPNLRMDIFELDPVTYNLIDGDGNAGNGLTAFTSANANPALSSAPWNPTAPDPTGSPFAAFARANQSPVTFNFNATLPFDTFGFFYHDVTYESGPTTAGSQLAAAATGEYPATVGFGEDFMFGVGINDPGQAYNQAVVDQPGRNLIASVTMVPEPASIGLLALGGLMLARRRR